MAHSGRGDLYYGGTTYENRQGLGIQLALAPHLTHASPEGDEESRCVPMKTNGWPFR